MNQLQKHNSSHIDVQVRNFDRQEKKTVNHGKITKLAYQAYPRKLAAPAKTSISMLQFSKISILLKWTDIFIVAIRTQGHRLV